jgi:hypothetical protein
LLASALAVGVVGDGFSESTGLAAGEGEDAARKGGAFTSLFGASAVAGFALASAVAGFDVAPDWGGVAGLAVSPEAAVGPVAAFAMGGSSFFTTSALRSIVGGVRFSGSCREASGFGGS